MPFMNYTITEINDILTTVETLRIKQFNSFISAKLYGFFFYKNYKIRYEKK